MYVGSSVFQEPSACDWHAQLQYLTHTTSPPTSQPTEQMSILSNPVVLKTSVAVKTTASHWQRMEGSEYFKSTKKNRVLGTTNRLLPFQRTLTAQKRKYATSRKVSGSVPDEVNGFLNWRDPSSRTMSLGSTRPLTEMSTRKLPGGKGRPARRADSLTAVCEPIVSLDVSQPYGPPQPVTGTALPYI
jgi:hypothetical protein